MRERGVSFPLLRSSLVLLAVVVRLSADATQGAPCLPSGTSPGRSNLGVGAASAAATGAAPTWPSTRGEMRRPLCAGLPARAVLAPLRAAELYRESAAGRAVCGIALAARAALWAVRGRALMPALAEIVGGLPPSDPDSRGINNPSSSLGTLGRGRTRTSSSCFACCEASSSSPAGHALTTHSSTLLASLKSPGKQSLRSPRAVTPGGLHSLPRRDRAAGLGEACLGAVAVRPAPWPPNPSTRRR